MRRVLILLLMFLMLLGLIVVSACANSVTIDVPENLFLTEPPQDGSVRISSYLGISSILTEEQRNNEIAARIPETINGKPVTEIGSRAFHDSQLEAGFILPDTVITVGESAFMNCFKLKNVVIGNQLTNMERFAFLGCHLLQSITLPGSVTEIGEQAFSYTGLQEVTLLLSGYQYYPAIIKSYLRQPFKSVLISCEGWRRYDFIIVGRNNPCSFFACLKPRRSASP